MSSRSGQSTALALRPETWELITRVGETQEMPWW